MIDSSSLALLAGLLLPWLAWALAMARARPVPCRADAQVFRVNAGWRWGGLFFLLGGPGLMGFAYFLIPPESVKPDDWVLVLGLSLFSGTGSLLGWLMMRARYCMDERGLSGYSIWGLPAYLTWDQVRTIDYSPSMEALRLAAGGRTLYVMVCLDDWPRFLRAAQGHLPHLAWPEKIGADNEKLAYESHWQSMYDNARWIALAGAGAAALPLLWLPLAAQALLLSVAAGALLALFPVARRLWPALEGQAPLLANLVQFVGIGGGIFCFSRAHELHVRYLGGDEAVSGLQFVAMMGLHLGAGVATLGALLLLAGAFFKMYGARK